MQNGGFSNKRRVLWVFCPIVPRRRWSAWLSWRNGGGSRCATAYRWRDYRRTSTLIWRQPKSCRRPSRPCSIVSRDKNAAPDASEFPAALRLSDNGCCAIRPPEALRAANRKTGIAMPENQKQTPFQRAPCVLVTLRLSTHQPTSRPCRIYLPFRPLPELENTATAIT